MSHRTRYGPNARLETGPASTISLSLRSRPPRQEEPEIQAQPIPDEEDAMDLDAEEWREESDSGQSDDDEGEGEEEPHGEGCAGPDDIFGTPCLLIQGTYHLARREHWAGDAPVGWTWIDGAPCLQTREPPPPTHAYWPRRRAHGLTQGAILEYH